MEYLVEFNPRDSELFELVSEAALDLCNYRLNKGENDESVKNLFQLLDEITQGEEPEVISNGEIYNVLFHAIPPEREKYKEYWEEYSKTRSRQVNEILFQTNLVAKDLRDFKSLSNEKLKTLENFCINLANELIFFHHTYHSGRGELIV